MKLTRRSALAGAAALSAAGIVNWRPAQADTSILLFDRDLAAGRRFAAAGQAAERTARPLAGDRIRLAQGILALRPEFIIGVSRGADAMMLADVGREAGYVRVLGFVADSDRCALEECIPAVGAQGELVRSAGRGWPEALASWAAADTRSRGGERGPFGKSDHGLVFGWVLGSRG